jgi:hypothetical protein
MFWSHLTRDGRSPRREHGGLTPAQECRCRAIDQCSATMADTVARLSAIVSAWRMTVFAVIQQAEPGSRQESGSGGRTRTYDQAWRRVRRACLRGRASVSPIVSCTDAESPGRPGPTGRSPGIEGPGPEHPADREGDRTVNKVMLTGRLTRDPEVRSLASGKNVTTFRDLPAMGSAGECAIPASPVSRDARRPGSPFPREVDVAFLWYSALSLPPTDELVGGDGERSSTAISDQSPLERCSSETAA